MQLEQQETFVIQGPQLEVLGTVESRLPPPARKRPVAALVLAVLALGSVVGIGGARLQGLRSRTIRMYASQQDEYGHSIQGDFAAQTDAAASLIRVAGNVLGNRTPTCRTPRLPWTPGMPKPMPPGPPCSIS